MKNTATPAKFQLKKTVVTRFTTVVASNHPTTMDTVTTLFGAGF